MKNRVYCHLSLLARQRTVHDRELSAEIGSVSDCEYESVTVGPDPVA